MTTPEEEEILMDVDASPEEYKQSMQRMGQWMSVISRLSRVQQRQREMERAAMYALPIVEKPVQVGKRGGLYYTNPRGKTVWLKRRQKERCQQGYLPGGSGVCHRE
jgi:hypothetical protein